MKPYKFFTFHASHSARNINTYINNNMRKYIEAIIDIIKRLYF